MSKISQMCSNENWLACFQVQTAWPTTRSHEVKIRNLVWTWFGVLKRKGDFRFPRSTQVQTWLMKLWNIFALPVMLLLQNCKCFGARNFTRLHVLFDILSVLQNGKKKCLRNEAQAHKTVKQSFLTKHRILFYDLISSDKCEGPWWANCKLNRGRWRMSNKMEMEYSTCSW